MASSYNFTVYQGASLDVRLTVKDSSGTAINFSGTSIRGHAKAHYYSSGKMINLSPTVFTGVTGIAYPSGLVDVKLSGSQTSGLPVTQGVYDIEQVTTGSLGEETNVERILAGKFTVYPESTR